MFGFDPKAMSDDELMKKQMLLASRIGAVSQLQSSSGLDQMVTMMQMITDEQRERMFLNRWNANSTIVNMPIETDPDLRDQVATVAELASKGPVAPRRNTVAVRRVIPTSTPVRPENEANSPPENKGKIDGK